MSDAPLSPNPVDLRELSKPLLLVGLLFTLLFAAYLRFIAIHETVNEHPYRSDVVQYYNTAFNLNEFGVYSHIIDLKDGKEVAPQPDAFVTPGYPLFLSLFVDGPPAPEIFQRAEKAQALLGTLAVALVFLLFALNGSPWIGLAAAFSLRMSRRGGIMIIIIAGVVAGSTVFVLGNVATALGTNQRLPVILAAWAIPIAALALGNAALLYLEDG